MRTYFLPARSAFGYNYPNHDVRNRRGINSTDWIHIDRALYDTCIDPRDYRPKKAP